MTPKLVFLRVKMPKFSKALAEHAFFFKKVNGMSASVMVLRTLTLGLCKKI